MQVAVNRGDAEPSVTDGVDGEIKVHADRGWALTVSVVKATGPVPPPLLAVTATGCDPTARLDAVV